MKNLIAVGSLVLLFAGTSFAQNEVTDQEAEVVFRVTLTEADAVNAKNLRDLSLSEVFKGESRTVFLVKTNSNNIERAKTEIENRFDSVRIEEINVAEISK